MLYSKLRQFFLIHAQNAAKDDVMQNEWPKYAPPHLVLLAVNTLHTAWRDGGGLVYIG